MAYIGAEMLRPELQVDGWDWVGSLCGVIIWAPLCGANKPETLKFFIIFHHYLPLYPSEYLQRIMFDHCHCQSIQYHCQNRCLKDGLIRARIQHHEEIKSNILYSDKKKHIYLAASTPHSWAAVQRPRTANLLQVVVAKTPVQSR